MIDRVFPQEIRRNFLKEACVTMKHMDVIEDVFAAYQDCILKKTGYILQSTANLC